MRTFGDWYEENSTEYNARRRARYKRDAKVRSKAIANARRQRANAPEPDRSNGTVRVEGKVRYKARYAAHLCGRSVQALRQWEARGWIPTSWVGEQRLYTHRQVQLMQRLAKVLTKYRYDPDLTYQIGRVTKEISKQWR